MTPIWCAVLTLAVVFLAGVALGGLGTWLLLARDCPGCVEAERRFDHDLSPRSATGAEGP